MHPFHSSYVQFTLVALSSIFFLVDPLAAIPTFLAVTAGSSRERRRHMARRAAWTCFLVLVLFAVAGSYIFRLFGITLPSFEIAGGLILLLIGLDMLQARRSPTHETPGDAAEAATKEDAGIVPLGIPMLAGPGAISTVMVLVGEAPRWWQLAAVALAVGVTATASFFILAAADRVRSALGETGIRILVRIMGLLLTALAVQFFINGITHLGLLRR